MKIKLSYDDLQTLRDANNSVIGTNEYTKYWMEMSSKYRIRDRWSGWKFMGHGIQYLVYSFVPITELFASRRV